MCNQKSIRTYCSAFLLFSLICNSLLGQWMEVTRIDGNTATAELDPIIDRSSFTSLNSQGSYDGSNINGPSVISIPAWIPDAYKAHPTAKYYLYFAHHNGSFIRMAWAANIKGPWTIFNYGTNSGNAWGELGNYSGKETPGNGVLDLAVEKDANGNPTWRIKAGNDFYALGHIASPDVQIDEVNQRIIMFYHAPIGGVSTGGQQTFVAVSKYGLNFNAPQDQQEVDWGQGTRAVIPGHFYFRTFAVKGKVVSPIDNSLIDIQQWFAFSNRGVLYKSRSFLENQKTPATLANADSLGGLFTPLTTHASGTAWWRLVPTSDNPLTGTIASPIIRDHANNIHQLNRAVDNANNGPRHFAVIHDEALDPNKIFLVYTGRADAPESMMLMTLDLTGLTDEERLDPKKWKKQHAIERLILSPKEVWEGSNLSLTVSTGGGASGVRALRDPAVFKDVDGKYYLFYSGKGEDALGMAEIKIVPTLELNIKIFLQGALDAQTGIMGSNLVTLESFPRSGYDYDVVANNFQHQQAPITNRMINAQAASKPVDWVIVELRSDLTTIVASREGVLLANGSIVDVDGAPLTFINVPAGDYFVAVKHRNHLAVMSEGKITMR
jgi:hypothetical protein